VREGWLRALLPQSPSPFEEPPAPSAHLPELIIGGTLFLLGIRSLVKWMRTSFEAESVRDHALFLLHAAARVGLWFAFAGFFLGFALVEEVGSFVKWYLFLPLGLAGLQLMTGVLLSRSPGNRPSMRSDNQPPGALEPEKHGETAEPGHPQPEAAEVESARLLENQARSDLRQAGFSDADIRRLADEYVALDRGEDLHAFIAWAKDRARR
jgi:hypothetical protein